MACFALECALEVAREVVSCHVLRFAAVERVVCVERLGTVGAQRVLATQGQAEASACSCRVSIDVQRVRRKCIVFIVGEGAVTNGAFLGREAGAKIGGFRVVDVVGQEPLNFVHAAFGEVVPKCHCKQPGGRRVGEVDGCGADSAQDADFAVVLVFAEGIARVRGEVWHQLPKWAPSLTKASLLMPKPPCERERSRAGLCRTAGGR